MIDYETEKIYKACEIANILRVNHVTILRWLQSGKVKGFKIGRKWLIKESELKKVMDGGREKD